jgi:hypothetical protein
LNGVLGYVLLLLLLIGGQAVVDWPGYFYLGGAFLLAWEVWVAVGILRCTFRTFREPYSTFGPIVARRGFGVLAVVVTATTIYYTIKELIWILGLHTAG